MAPLDLGSFLADVGDVLQELSIDEGTIKAILTSLEGAATDIPGEHELRPIPDGVFSALPAGARMGLHTNNAQTYLLGVMTEMMEILGLYRDGVVAYKSGTTTTDEFSAAELTKINHVVDQASQVNTRGRPHEGDNA